MGEGEPEFGTISVLIATVFFFSPNILIHQFVKHIWVMLLYNFVVTFALFFVIAQIKNHNI